MDLVEQWTRRRRARPSPHASAPHSAAVTAATSDTTHIRVSSLQQERPQLFYLPAAAMESLCDCHAIVEGRRWPLHSQARDRRWAPGRTSTLQVVLCASATHSCVEWGPAPHLLPAPPMKSPRCWQQSPA